MNTVQLHCLAALLALGGCTALTDHRTELGTDQPPNAVRHSPRLMTSGQPPVGWFASHDASQVEVIVHLWASKSAELSFNEAQIAGHQRKLYVFQTIDFDRPSAEDLVMFVSLMNAFPGRNVQVHCQLNALASSMVFLYEVIEEQRDAYVAYEDVLRVWSPNGTWKRYFHAVLAGRGIAFEPY